MADEINYENAWLEAEAKISILNERVKLMRKALSDIANSPPEVSSDEYDYHISLAKQTLLEDEKL